MNLYLIGITHYIIWLGLIVISLGATSIISFFIYSIYAINLKRRSERITRVIKASRRII